MEEQLTEAFLELDFFGLPPPPLPRSLFCKKCGFKKDLENFYVDHKRRKKFWKCKECAKRISAEHYSQLWR